MVQKIVYLVLYITIVRCIKRISKIIQIKVTKLLFSVLATLIEKVSLDLAQFKVQVCLEGIWNKINFTKF